MIGKTISHYRVTEKLGAGGMGEVYRAKDTRLDRTVALKVLTSEKVADPERKRRFVQEAKAASALNHPNIVTIYDISSDNGVDFIAMEYVAGKTLDQIIPRKGLRLNEALKYAIQIADALAKAHAAGIVHRDLKPANVMVNDEGMVKVLDFGLAKLVEPGERDQGGEATITKQAGPPSTEEGTILGTVAYMSPEQAEGKKVDSRSDIFSFGSVLYEMLTGQRAFQGDSKMSTLAAILKQEPKPTSQLIPGVPRDLEKVIHRCLRKEPGRRFQHMDDLKVALEELKEESDSGTLGAALPTARPSRQSWVWAGAALAVVGIAVATWLFHGTSRKPAAMPVAVPLTSYGGLEQSPSFSPDGNQVAFSWNGETQDNFDIYLKLIGSSNYVRLTTDSAGDVSPAFSPDGRSIGFFRVSKGRATFMVIPAIGGPERIIADVGVTFESLFEPSFAWFPDSRWVVTDGLALLSIESGESRSLTSPPTGTSPDYSPAVSPDGRTVAFSRSEGTMASEIYLLDLTEDLKPKGGPRRLTSLKSASFGPAWTPDGREIIFTSLASGAFGRSSLWKVPASGTGEPEQLPFTRDDACCPAISRSGNRLAYQRHLVDSNIWRLSLSGPGVASRAPESFIASTRLDSTPQYSPDGKQIAFESERGGPHSVWVCDSDNSHFVELFSRPGTFCGSAHWSPDGQRIAFDFSAEGNSDIYDIRSSGGKPTRLTTHAASDIVPTWSRDGKWVYFASNRTGRWEVWKVAAGGGEAVQVTRNGGATAFESADGQSVYYTKAVITTPSALWKMPISGGEESQVLPSVFWGAFSLVNEGIYFIPAPGADGKSSIQFLSFATAKVKTVAPISRPGEGLSVSPDGRAILFTQGDEGGSDLMLVENFR